MGSWIHKHRSTLLVCLLTAALCASYLARERELSLTTSAVTLPVVSVTAAPSTALEAFRTQREESALRDMAALEALVNQEALDSQSRADAADQLRRMVEQRQKQTALEGALTQSGVYPCAAVVEEGSVTIVTEKTGLTEGETALILTLCEAHAGVAPGGVRVITAGE